MKRSDDMESFCRICGHIENGKKLSNHIKKNHGLSSMEYTTQYIFDGIRPLCQACNLETRYTSFKFMKYCAEHSFLAESEAGKKGGLASAWNKGLSANLDNRIFRPSGELNPFWGKKHTDETKQKISKTKRLSSDKLLERLSERADSFTVLTPLEDYQSRQGQYLEFTCNRCKKKNKKTLQAFERGSLCDQCFPNTTSQPEAEIEEWLKSCGLSAERSDRAVISPKELDIVIHDKKFAIEYDGLYWHSELSGNNVLKSAHKNKTQLCLEKGWQLVHVFSDDWRDRKNIVKSMILHKLGVSQERIHARSCHIKEISRQERSDFFGQNHLSGDVSSKKAWALVDSSNEIVAAISVRAPLQKKWKNRLEIARFAIKAGKHIPGALSKLLKRVNEFATNEQKKGLISYADRRHGEGKCYLESGFVYAGDTGIDYWYTDGRTRFDRFSFKANGDLTEKQRATSAGVGKIWGCGNNVWILDF